MRKKFLKVSSAICKKTFFLWVTPLQRLTFAEEKNMLIQTKFYLQKNCVINQLPQNSFNIFLLAGVTLNSYHIFMIFTGFTWYFHVIFYLNTLGKKIKPIIRKIRYICICLLSQLIEFVLNMNEIVLNITGFDFFCNHIGPAQPGLLV